MPDSPERSALYRPLLLALSLWGCALGAGGCDQGGGSEPPVELPLGTVRMVLSAEPDTLE
jgi:hypothetical protein